MDKFISDIISQRNLSSLMNNTKWKKLVTSITSNPEFEPEVNIKYLFDQDNNGKFCPVWWSEIERDGYERIEWLEIRAFKEFKQGSLIEPKKLYYTNFLSECLESASIPFFLENDIFRVNAYQ